MPTLQNTAAIIQNDRSLIKLRFHLADEPVETFRFE